MTELDLSDLLGKIKEKNPGKILLQVPEGLKTKVSEIARKIEEDTKAEVFIAGEPCYGACDLPLHEAKILECDLVVHLGHLDFGVKTEIPVLYFPVEYQINLTEEIKSELKKIEETEVGIYSSVQFKKILDELENFLFSIGKKITEKRVILGCLTLESKNEASIFVGSGKFHPLALKGKVYFIDLEKNKLSDLTESVKKEEMKKQARIANFKDSKKIGILISTKPGQFFKDYKKLEENLEKQGKMTQILIMSEITNEKLIGLDFDAYLNTACPRILDRIFDKLIVNIRDLGY